MAIKNWLQHLVGRLPLAAGGTGARPVREAELTGLVLERLRQRLPDRTWSSPEPLRIAHAEGHVDLANIHRRCVADPASLESEIRAFVAAAAEALDSPPGTREQLVARIWSGSQATAAGGGDHLVAERLVDDLHVVYEFDLPQTIRPIAAADLARLGIDRAACARLAKANLARMLADANQIVATSAKDGRWLCSIAHSGNAGFFTSALSLVDRFWTAGNPVFAPLGVTGEFVMLLPCRSRLIVTTTASGPFVHEAQRLAGQNFAEEPYPISTRCYVRRDGGWQDWQPPAA